MADHDHSNQQHHYILENFTVATLTEAVVARCSATGADDDPTFYPLVQHLELNFGLFTQQYPVAEQPVVEVIQHPGWLEFSCGCSSDSSKLCLHESRILLAILRRDELRAFFDEKLRHEKLKKLAADYGLEHETRLDDYFELKYQHKKLEISPRQKSILQVTKESLHDLQALLLPPMVAAVPQKTNLPDDSAMCVVIKQHKYYGHLYIELYEAKTTKEGKVKNPLTLVNPLELLWEYNDPEVLKFFTAISRFQNNIENKQDASAMDSLRAIVKNPLGLTFLYHDSSVSEKITATAVKSVQVRRLKGDIKLKVDQKSSFFELSGTLKLDDQLFKLADLQIRFTYFVFIADTLFLVDHLNTLALINFFKKKAGNILVHQTRYREFKTNILSKLEEGFQVDYAHLKTATPEQLVQQGFDGATDKLIYLSDFGGYVMVIPVVRYGEAEISIRTHKQIYATDDEGYEFLVQRNEEEELKFMALLIKQHPLFLEQMDDQLHYFYLHKKRFLDENWFLDAFEEWRQHGITVLGFNELEGNKLNPHKVSITVNVQTGINWFNTKAVVGYGRKKASMKKVHKAVRNKSKYVELDDGTLGILPEYWIAKFAGFFAAGEVVDDETIQTSKMNYLSVSALYDREMLDEAVSQELKLYQQKLADFTNIQSVAIPAEFKGTLRHYQHEGLSWLNFLDDFNFGGCLADDMGLGKTVQIIAFILLQRQKVAHNTNLLVVPTSIIFNWQAEVQKFAPSIKVYTPYGADREKSTRNFNQYELVITTYGTLLSDINFLKDYTFNYVFLDESQNIKNPTSQRYKAVRLLKSRNKIAITGTPIENNTFDLYGQLSFACPGLLGSKQYFKDIYSSPIDKFKVSRRSRELQEKVRPFILRRTKKQVASELPDKTEMVLYCEMKPDQRQLYDAYEKEFREFISATTSEELPRKSMHVLKGLTKLRQICNSPKLLKGEKIAGESSSKIDLLMEEIDNRADVHKILIFSQFVSMLDLIKAELLKRNVGHAYLTGSTRNREAVVKSFQEDEAVRVFLISLKAGGTGLNLTEADYVYIVDPWWNPAVENQAIDRCYRIGQKKNAVAVRLICPKTIEQKIMRLQKTKQSLADRLIEADTPIMQSLSKDDLMDLLSND